MIVFKKTVNVLGLLSCALLCGCAGSSSVSMNSSDKAPSRAVYANSLSFMPDSVSENYIYETPYSVNIPLKLMVPVYIKSSNDRWNSQGKSAEQAVVLTATAKRGPIKVIKRGDGRFSALEGLDTLLLLDRLGAGTVPVELTYPQAINVFTIDKFKSMTRQARPDFITRVSALAGRFNGRTEIITGSLNEKRVKAQALENYDGNFGGITDILVGRIFFDRESDLKKAIGYIRIRDDIIAFEDNFSKRPDLRQDCTALLRTGNGIIGTIHLALAQ